MGTKRKKLATLPLPTEDPIDLESEDSLMEEIEEMLEEECEEDEEILKKDIEFEFFELNS